LGVRSWREITFGYTLAKDVEVYCSNPLHHHRNIYYIWLLVYSSYISTRTA
jgi:hypothetical protein